MLPYFHVSSILPLGIKTNPVATVFIVVFAAICTYFCWWYWKLNRAYAKFPSVRMEFRGLWKLFSGKYTKNVPFTCGLFQEMVNMSKQFEKEGLFVVWFFRPYLLIYNMDVMKRLQNEPAAVNKISAYNMATDVFGNGLVTSKDVVWKSHRKILNSGFHTGKLKENMLVFNENSVDLVNRLKCFVGQSTFDIKGLLDQISFNIMSETVLELNLKGRKYEAKVENYMKAVNETFHILVSRAPFLFLHWKFTLPFFSLGRKYLKLVEDIHSFTQEVVLEMKNSIIATDKSEMDLNPVPGEKKSFARILLEQHLKDSSFTLKDVHDQITTFMAAGHDAVSHALLWCLYELGLHPDVQQKAFKEIESLGATDISYEDLYELKYIECIIKETLRVCSVVPLYARNLNKEIQLDNYTIPNGTDVIFFLYMLNKSPDIHADPEKFDPDRFLKNTDLRPWMYLPFAEGYRSCIGKRFAMMEMKVILAHIIRSFRIETLEKINASEVAFAVTLEPIKPVKLLFTLR